MDKETHGYTIQDRLTLWMLTDPGQPALVGELSLASGGQGVGLRYSDPWRAAGYALSEDLPLTGELFLPPDRKGAPGAVEDARPDRWGERVIRRFERSPRLSVLELLLFSGADRYGALGVSQRADAYEPWGRSPLPQVGELAQMLNVVRKVIANEPVPELEKRLLRPGVSLGGARPKSLIEMDGQAWLIKFGEGEDEDTPLIEHATMMLAARCGIDVAQTRALPVQGRHAVAVRRFDRDGMARVHAVSAHVILRAVGEPFGYPQLAQQLRRLCRADEIERQQVQLFRRMVFNILMDNTDDHEKNHALLRQADGFWRLSPAYDIVPSLSGLGVQAMLVGKDGHDSTLHNAVSSCKAFGMNHPQAVNVVHEICEVVEQWQLHFQASTVSDADLAVLAQYLDNDRLGSQRRLSSAAEGRPAARFAKPKSR